MVKPSLFQAFLLFWLLGVSIAQSLTPLYGNNTCSSASGTEDKQVTGNATLDQYYGWGFYPRCVIANPPQELPSNWTYRCLGIPVLQNDTSYFSYPDNSPCTCSDGCYNYTEGPPAKPIFYGDDEVEVWDVSKETSKRGNETVIDTIASTNNTDDQAQALGQVVLDGPPQMLASMHPRSGWKILDCQKHPEPQKLLAYCSRPHHMASGKADNDSSSPQCRDVFLKEAKNTIVILPDGCGSSLVARVASLKPTSKPLPDSERQILGVNKSKQITVYELEMDYKFDEVPNDEGNVSIAVDFTNLPEYMTDLKSENSSVLSEDSSVLSENEMGDRWRKWLKKVTQYSVSSSSVFSSSIEYTEPLIDVSQTCRGFTASLYADVTGEFRANVKFSYKFVGTIVPLKLTDHYVYLEVDPTISVALGVYGLASYSYNSGEFLLLPPQKIPKLNYDPVISFSPYVSISGRIRGPVQLSGSFLAKTTHNFAPIRLSLGSNMHDIDNATNRSPSPDNGGSMSTNAEVRLQAGLGFTLIPRVGFGLLIGNGELADAKVELQARGTISATVTGSVNSSRHAEACFSLDSTIDLSWIVSGHVLGLWGAYSQTLYSKAFPLYKKCVETGWATIPAMTRRDGLLGSLCPKVTEDPTCSLQPVSGAGGDDTDPPTNVSSTRRFSLVRRYPTRTELKFCGETARYEIESDHLINIKFRLSPVITAGSSIEKPPRGTIDHVLEKYALKSFLRWKDPTGSGSLCYFVSSLGLAALVAPFKNPEYLIFVSKTVNKMKTSLYSGRNYMKRGDRKAVIIHNIENIISVIRYLNQPEVIRAGLKAMRDISKLFARYDERNPGKNIEADWKVYSKETFAIISRNAQAFSVLGRSYIEEQLTNDERCYLDRNMVDFELRLAGESFG